MREAAAVAEAAAGLVGKAVANMVRVVVAMGVVAEAVVARGAVAGVMAVAEVEVEVKAEAIMVGAMASVVARVPAARG